MSVHIDWSKFDQTKMTEAELAALALVTIPGPYANRASQEGVARILTVRGHATSTPQENDR